MTQDESASGRRPENPVQDLLINRWSPRAFTSEPITDEELLSLFEAARWAPSSFNEQPWRFIYAKRESEYWGTFLGLLGEFNRLWARNASVLILAVSSESFTRNGKPNRHHGFDCGAAWLNLALQASAMGFAAHAMAGFDAGRSVAELGIPDGHAAQAMIAVGKPGSVELLPPEMRGRETPSSRRPISTFVKVGTFDRPL